MRSTRLIFGTLALVATSVAAFVGTEGCSSDTFTATDAAATSDATGDGASSDAGARFCASHPEATFCDDFDGELDGSQFDPRWKTLVVGGTVTRSADAVSAPGAIVSSAGPATGPTTALLSYDANMKVAHHLELQAKVKLESACAGGLFSIFSFAGAIGGVGVTVALITYPTATAGTTLALYTETKGDAGKKDAVPSTIDVALGKWTDVTFKVDFDTAQPDGGKGTNVKATYGGATILDLNGAEGAAVNGPLFTVGVSADSPITTCAIHYDDVIFLAGP